MKYSVLFFLFIGLQFTYAQLIGKVTDATGMPIAFATIRVENTSSISTTNANGEYEITQLNEGIHTVYCQQLDYKTEKKTVTYRGLNTLNFTLEQTFVPKNDTKEEFSEDFTKEFIKKTIQHRKINLEKLAQYNHSFYSKGAMEITNFPKKVIGYDIQQLDPNLKLDSLKNKYVFTSETFSAIDYKHPNDYKENIIAYTTTGNNQGYNFHTSYFSDFNFYHKEAYKNWKLISPIANNGPIYYKYTIVDYTIDQETNHKIYKIKVKPIRDVDAVVDGYIYITENTHEIYGIDFTTKGYRVGTPQVDEYHIKQQYIYDKISDQYLKAVQNITFSGKIIVFEFRSEYQQLYNNWTFDKSYNKKFFTQQLISYAEDAHKSDTKFWNRNRPILLTQLQNNDNVSEDQATLENKTKQHQDSIDRINNKFNLFKMVVGYKNRNSFKNETYKYNGLLSTFAFNAVQGFNVTTGISYLKENPKKETYYEFGGLVNYGIAENKPRFSGYYTQLFNRQDYAKLDVSGGAVVHQFGEEYPIKKLINSLASSYFGKNFAKFYKKEFIRIAYEQELFNGFMGKMDVEYANRLPLFNNTVNSPFVKNKLFGSNNPIDPTNFNEAGFEQNSLFKLRLKATYHIGQKYVSYPHKKINIRNSKYPSFTITYENGFGAKNEENNYSLYQLSSKYETYLGTIGNLGLYVNGGKFFHSDFISFMDYKHFYGNETFIGTNQNYLGKFNLMPYYSMSTNKDFIEWHVEHNFKGFILNKIPLIRDLQYHIILGVHGMQTGDRNPYFEYSVGLDNFGIKKFRPFRIDYFRSSYNGEIKNGVILGIKLLDKMN